MKDLLSHVDSVVKQFAPIPTLFFEGSLVVHVFVPLNSLVPRKSLVTLLLTNKMYENFTSKLIKLRRRLFIRNSRESFFVIVGLGPTHFLDYTFSLQTLVIYEVSHYFTIIYKDPSLLCDMLFVTTFIQRFLNE